MDSSSGAFIKTIEWDMMDKKKFFPLSMLSSFSVRCALFPLTVIKTQLQVRRERVSRRLIAQYVVCFGCSVHKDRRGHCTDAVVNTSVSGI